MRRMTWGRPAGADVFFRAGLRLLVLGLCAVLASSATGALAKAKATKPAAPVPLTASQSVERFNDGLIAALRKTDGQGFEARKAAFAPLVASAFDANFMAKYAVGRKVVEASPAQSKALVDAFRDMTVASYASQFKAFKGQKFETLSETAAEKQCASLRDIFKKIGETSAPESCATVQTQLTNSKGEQIKIGYKVYKAADDSTWKIWDVMNGPASQLTTRRSEFMQTVNTGGIDGVIALLKNNTIKLAQESRAAGGAGTATP